MNYLFNLKENCYHLWEYISFQIVFSKYTAIHWEKGQKLSCVTSTECLLQQWFMSIRLNLQFQIQMSYQCKTEQHPKPLWCAGSKDEIAMKIVRILVLYHQLHPNMFPVQNVLLSYSARYKRINLFIMYLISPKFATCSSIIDKKKKKSINFLKQTNKQKVGYWIPYYRVRWN